MGACLSSSQSKHREPMANVVSTTGDLHQYETPVTVSEVLLHLSQVSSSSSHSGKFFVSNSDSLRYDEHIPAMESREELQENQIYFVFPASKLQNRLSASDMAALAVKASLALSKTKPASLFSKPNSKPKIFPSSDLQNRRRGQNKISPYFESEQSSNKSQRLGGYDFDQSVNNTTVKRGPSVPGMSPAAGGLSRSGSLRKRQRFSSKRAKLAVRSFRLKLSTIHEGSVVQFF